MAACFGASLIRLPRPPAGMGGGGAGPPRFTAGGAEAGCGLAAPVEVRRCREAISLHCERVALGKDGLLRGPCNLAQGAKVQQACLWTWHTLHRVARQ